MSVNQYYRKNEKDKKNKKDKKKDKKDRKHKSINTQKISQEVTQLVNNNHHRHSKGNRKTKKYRKDDSSHINLYCNFKKVRQNDTWKKMMNSYNPNRESLGVLAVNLLQSTDLEQYSNTYNEIEKYLIGGLERIVITLPDGTVAADTSQDNNTFQNFHNKLINENHGTRIAIISAQISTDGTGDEIKYSTTTHEEEVYHAENLEYDGPGKSYGTLRISAVLDENDDNIILNPIDDCDCPPTIPMKLETNSEKIKVVGLSTGPIHVRTCTTTAIPSNLDTILNQLDLS